jgi:hypothetical protein
MERIKIIAAPSFYYDELIDPHTYLTNLNAGKVWADRIAPAAQLLRNTVGKPCTSNNWWLKYVTLQQSGLSVADIIKEIESSSARKWSGSRPAHCTEGSAQSAHRITKEGAIDIVVAGMSGEQLFNIVKANAKAFHQAGIRRLETPKLATSWLHMDLREHNLPKTIIVVDLVKRLDPIVFV